jgi:hypothetical protein
MNTQFFGSTFSIDEDLFTLEEKLRGILQPVTPRSDFVQDLHDRLMRRNKIINLIPQQIQSILFIFWGIVGSFAILLMGFRAVLSLVSVVGIIRQQYRKYKGQLKESRPVSTPSAISN